MFFLADAAAFGAWGVGFWVGFLEGAGFVFALGADFFTADFFATGFFAGGFLADDFFATGLALFAALGLTALAGFDLAAGFFVGFWAMAVRCEECGPAFRDAACFLADMRPGKLRGGF
jgi:hypothetical protein